MLTTICCSPVCLVWFVSHFVCGHLANWQLAAGSVVAFQSTFPPSSGRVETIYTFRSGPATCHFPLATFHCRGTWRMRNLVLNTFAAQICTFVTCLGSIPSPALAQCPCLTPWQHLKSEIQLSPTHAHSHRAWRSRPGSISHAHFTPARLLKVDKGTNCRGRAWKGWNVEHWQHWQLYCSSEFLVNSWEADTKPGSISDRQEKAAGEVA